jgi:hypothetical protein
MRFTKHVSTAIHSNRARQDRCGGLRWSHMSRDVLNRCNRNQELVKASIAGLKSCSACHHGMKPNGRRRGQNWPCSGKRDRKDQAAEAQRGGEGDDMVLKDLHVIHSRFDRPGGLVAAKSSRSCNIGMRCQICTCKGPWVSCAKSNDQSVWRPFGASWAHLGALTYGFDGVTHAWHALMGMLAFAVSTRSVWTCRVRTLIARA